MASNDKSEMHTSKAVTVRLPIPVYNAVKEHAMAECRSVTAEVVYILKQALRSND